MVVPRTDGYSMTIWTEEARFNEAPNKSGKKVL
jgi:hypothetical protein